VRPCTALVLLALAARSASAQMTDTVTHDKTFLTRKDLGVSVVALGATALLSRWDTDIAKA
jgi:hypothetical protein